MIKYLLATCCILLAILCLAWSPTSVSAATPTPSPTLRPIAATPTSNTIYLRPTPTALFVPTAAYTVVFLEDPGGMADSTINSYRYLNSNHLIDLFGSFALVAAVVRLLVKLVRNQTRTNT